jgi:hypothetical protein
MVLLHHIVEILALAQTNAARQRAGRFQGCHGGRKCTVLIHVDDLWDRIARRTQSFTKKALSGRRVSFGGEQVWPVESTARYRYYPAL